MLLLGSQCENLIWGCITFVSSLIQLGEQYFSPLQHQQQVAQAVERAKQVTMAELNGIIGVRGLPGLPTTVCITSFLYLITYIVQCLLYCIRV